MAESYTLREVAELLGVSKRTLQRRIREGAFPGRFLAPGRHGLETRVPSGDVKRVLEEMQRPSAAPYPIPHLDEIDEDDGPEESMVPYRAPAGLQRDDIHALREALVLALADERALFLEELRGALAQRDATLNALRGQMDQVVVGLESLRKQVGALGRPAEVPAPREPVLMSERPRDPVDAVLEEIAALERMVGAFQRH